ncbi:hypothetical protein HWV62_10563 [Athelia sp. TMB]|nr:hypothetical protein HWV62_10563 [Athelia sp. TMB]
MADSTILTCSGCRKTLATRGALTQHQNTCKKIKTRFASSLTHVARLQALKEANKLSRRKEGLNTTRSQNATSSSNIISQADSRFQEEVRDVEMQDVEMLDQSIPQAASVHEGELEPVHPQEAEPEQDLSLSIADRRQRRKVQLPARFVDFVPQPLNDVIDAPSSPPSSALPSPRPVSTPAPEPTKIDTAQNVYGLFRRFIGDQLPSHDPESRIDLRALTDSASTPGGNVDLERTALPNVDSQQSLYPFDNLNAFLVGEWFYSDDASTSVKRFNQLLGIIGAPEFKPEDIRNTNWKGIHKILGSNASNSEESPADEWLDEDAGWKKKPIRIKVPFHRHTTKPGPREFAVGDLYHRSLVEIIREKLSNPADDAQFHYEPYELRWQPRADGATSTRVHGEFYTSPAFRSAHEKLQAAENEPGCSLPKVVLAMEFASDSTQLAHFGSAKLWPVYLYFLNESKYRRCKPTSNLCNHVAYFQSLPDSFNDFVAQHYKGRVLSRKHTTHCRRELFHAQWDILLDEDFMHAYVHGIVVICCDGISRRFYPRIFIYAADYPEKVLIASIRDKGQCPCPRCTMSISEVAHLGAPADIALRARLARVDDEEFRRTIRAARELILEGNHAVDSKAVEALLKTQSLTPTSNAFSRKLGPLGFNIFKALLTDLMHEFELGVWKGLLIHLLRILEAHDKTTKTTIREFNERFRSVPSFGKDTIRRFVNDVSELKQLAARDYEDLLQCFIPVFDGLLPEPHNSDILSLLFTCAHWHGLAKLRMHTDSTIVMLESEAAELYVQLRHFADVTCEAFDTHELKREVAARQRAQQRRDQKKADAAPTSSKGKGKARPFAPSEATGPQSKRYHLNTIKHHFLVDYPAIIREYGTTDSYTTEGPELEHKRPKKRYTRTSRKYVASQLAALERRANRIRRIKEKLYGVKQTADDERMAARLDIHHFMGKTENDYINIGKFISNNSGDPAINGFYKKLKVHLMPRVLTRLREKNDINIEKLPQIEQCDADRFISFDHNQLYQHRILRINYTTYDVRRDQDLVNGHSAHCNIMVLCQHSTESNASDGSTYRYGRVLGTYHVNINYNGPGRPYYHEKHRMEILWIRWYEEVGELETGCTHKRLGRLRFPPIEDDDAFGFVDPADVLRGCHIIPRFRFGKVHKEGIGYSPLINDGLDWKQYYINRFVDRDMVMRYHLGHGIGHLYGHSFYTDLSRRATTADIINMPTAPSVVSSASLRDVDMGTRPDCNSDNDGGGGGDGDGDSDGDSNSNSNSSLDLDDGDEQDPAEDDLNISDIEESELYAEDMYNG